jgi:hypothetical protein
MVRMYRRPRPPFDMLNVAEAVKYSISDQGSRANLAIGLIVQTLYAWGALTEHDLGGIISSRLTKVEVTTEAVTADSDQAAVQSVDTAPIDVEAKNDAALIRNHGSRSPRLSRAAMESAARLETFSPAYGSAMQEAYTEQQLSEKEKFRYSVEKRINKATWSERTFVHLFGRDALLRMDEANLQVIYGPPKPGSPSSPPPDWKS